MKKIIKVTDTLPPAKAIEKRQMSKKKFLELAEKVRLILIKEGKLKGNEDIYFSRPLFSN